MYNIAITEEQQHSLQVSFFSICSSRRFRYLAYRQFVAWCWGFLGRRIRVVIPACVVLRIRAEYPDDEGHYTGFRLPHV